jgi:hypothetical protein
MVRFRRQFLELHRTKPYTGAFTNHHLSILLD